VRIIGMPPADLHVLLLEDYFFSWVDRGVAVGATPLFTGVVEGEDLPSAVGRRFGLPPEQVEEPLALARREVAL